MSVPLLIPILILIPLALGVMHQIGMRFGLIWLSAFGVALIAWVEVLAAAWILGPAAGWGGWGFVPLLSPAQWFIVDPISWPIAFALTALGLTAVLTSLSGLTEVDWRSLGVFLALVGVSLAGALAASIAVLLTAWAAADIFQLVVLLVRVRDEGQAGQAVNAFSASTVGILIALLAVVFARSQGLPLADIPLEANPWLVLAALIRLGLVPFQPPLFPEVHLRRGLGSLLRLAPSAGAFVLLARAAESGFPETGRILLLAAAALAGLYAALRWMTSRGDLEGRSFWILGMASIAVIATVQRLPQAVLAIAFSVLFGGGLLFMAASSRLRLRWLYAVMLLLMSGLPFTPTWPVSGIVSTQLWPWGVVTAVLSALMMLGYLRLSFRQAPEGKEPVAAVNALFMAGLAVLPVSMVFGAWSPVLRGGGIAGGWWEGGLVLLLAGILAALEARGLVPAPAVSARVAGWLTFRWLLVPLDRIYRLTGRGVRFISRLLEGEASVIWALLLLALLITLFSQLGVGS